MPGQGRIRDDSITQVRGTTDIVALIGEYVALRPAGGQRMKGLCPFHQEKTPSFTVNPAKGTWYCLAGETRVLTWDGMRPIRELAGGIHRVLARNGNWVDAPFYSFGVQPLMRITLTRNRQTKELYATPEHRWIVRSGRFLESTREIQTKDLKPGRRLAWRFPGSRVKRTTPSPFGIAHGITFGDGTRMGAGSMAMLDPVKDATLLKWFPNSVVTEPSNQLLVHHLPGFFKDLPPLSESVPYLYGWLAGYVAADGHVSKDGTVMLNCADRDTLEHVRAVCTRLGIGTYGITGQLREGFPGREPSWIYRIHFINEDLTEEFFLLDEHRIRFAGTTKKFTRRGWTVRSVEMTDRVEEVFCAVVDQGHAFTLEDNILTGNCFGCNESGDAIDFLQKHAALSFVEAVERLAQRAGVQLTYEGRAAGERGNLGRKSRLVAAHSAAVEFYQQVLREDGDAAGARAYLESRGYDQATAARFQLGWAPERSWDALTSHLRKRGFTPEELQEAGLSRAGSRGLRDTFHARVLFPILDVAGDPVAFGGRILGTQGDARRNAPKYVNTPETAIWHKGRVLYALNWAKQAIVQAGFALVVEGYTDVISLHAAGVQQAVATCGTALRAEHFKLLARFTDKVVLAFDADTAGSRAADRGVGELISAPEASISAHVLTMPEGLDPADFVARHGGTAFTELVQGATPLVGWWLETTLMRHDLRTEEGRLRASREVLPILERIPDSQQRGHYASVVVNRLGLRMAVGGREMEALIFGASQQGGKAHAKAPPKRLSPEARVERDALKLALQHPDWTAEAAQAWAEDWFTTPATRASFVAVTKAGGVGSDLDAILEQAANENERRFLRGLAVESFAADEEHGYAETVFHRLEELRLTRVIDARKGTLQRMNPVEQQDHYNQVFNDLIALEARRRVLREAAARG